MGDPRKLKRKYEKPKHPWEFQNLRSESDLIKKYGLKNKKEVWKAESQIRKYRKQARKLTGTTEEKNKEQKFLEKLKRIGLLKENQQLDDVLSLTTEDYLKRRLQTQAWKKGYGKTPKEARQLIVHGHIQVKGRRTTKPSKTIRKGEEATIDWYGEPIEQAKGKETPEELVEKAKEEGKIEEKPKQEEETEEKETQEEKETETGELDYSEIVKENIADIKEEVKDSEVDYEKLLEAEKENKDRKTLKKWIKRKGDLE